MKQLLPAEFRDTFPRALQAQTTLLWLWTLPDAFATYSPGLMMAFTFEVDPGRNVLLVRNEPLAEQWAIGHPEAVRYCLSSYLDDTREIYLDEPSWYHPAFDDLRRSWHVHQRAIHFRGGNPGEWMDEAGRATRDELSQLRALDLQQYGRILEGVDYQELVDAGVSWVARRGNRLHSCALVAPLPGFACLSSLWTDPVYRRHGAARRLMNAVLNWCHQEERVLALNVDEENSGAVALYRELAMEEVGRFVTIRRR